MSDLPVLTDDHVDKVCLPGKGVRTCRYLTVMGGAGWNCAKFRYDLAGIIDQRVAQGTMVARGNNCEGRTNRPAA